MEKETNSFFSVKTSKGNRKYYECHRSGYYVPSGNRIRRLKSQGSCKINAKCPARMWVQKDDNKVQVVFHKTHAGHSTDAKYITSEKSKIKNRKRIKVSNNDEGEEQETNEDAGNRADVKIIPVIDAEKPMKNIDVNVLSEIPNPRPLLPKPKSTNDGNLEARKQKLIAKFTKIVNRCQTMEEVDVVEKYINMGIEAANRVKEPKQPTSSSSLSTPLFFDKKVSNPIVISNLKQKSSPIILPFKEQLNSAIHVDNNKPKNYAFLLVKERPKTAILPSSEKSSDLAISNIKEHLVNSPIINPQLHLPLAKLSGPLMIPIPKDKMNPIMTFQVKQPPHHHSIIQDLPQFVKTPGKTYEKVWRKPLQKGAHNSTELNPSKVQSVIEIDHAY